MVRDIPLIVSLSLFLAIILTITQLYKNSEAVVMNSVGLSNKDFFLIIQIYIRNSYFIMTSIILTYDCYHNFKKKYDLNYNCYLLLLFNSRRRSSKFTVAKEEA